MHTNKPQWNDICAIVINLARDTERRSFMGSQLHSLGIPHSFLEATDGRTYDFSDIYNEAHTIAKNGRPLTPAEKGCALSHKRALESFLASGKSYGLVMEDDIAIDHSFPHAVAYALRTRSQHPWTYLQFNYSPVGWHGIQLWWFLFLRNRADYSLPRFIMTCLKGLGANTLSLLWGIRDTAHRLTHTSAIYGLVRDQYLAGCYILTRDAAVALIELNTPLTYTADRIQNIARRQNRIKHRIYVPRLIRQKRESFASSINNEHFGTKVISY